MQNQDAGQSQWFVAVGDSWVGPLSVADVHGRIEKGELSWVHYAWKEGQAEWTRISDIAAFQAALPHAPKAKPAPKMPPIPPVAIKKDWFLYQDSQSGPYAEDEILGMISTGRVTGDAYGWKEGMGDWVKIGALDAFEPACKKVKSLAKAGGAEKRQAPRKSLLAKIIVAGDANIGVGMCRDISIGGMQVLTDAIPGKVGQKIKLNVSPMEGGLGSFEPFVAEGVIVRVLDEGRGFSFRFDRLNDQARAVIEKHVLSN